MRKTNKARNFLREEKIRENRANNMATKGQV